MRIFPCLAISFTFLVFALNPFPASAGGKSEDGSALLPLVGFTSETLLKGDAGIINMNIACNAEFPGSRMCDAEEVAKTVNPPDSLSFPEGHEAAWVRPALGDTESVLSQDKDCDDWTATDSSGIAVFAEDLPNTKYGQIKAATCETERPVSCCGSASKKK